MGAKLRKERTVEMPVKWQGFQGGAIRPWAWVRRQAMPERHGRGLEAQPAAFSPLLEAPLEEFRTGIAWRGPGLPGLRTRKLS